MSSDEEQLLLLFALQSKKKKRRRWVYEINKKREQLGEYHRLCIKLESHKGKSLANEERENVEEVVMKKARFEVYKFAQTGLSNVERQKSQFDLALKLGAVPRKNKAINYKVLKEEKQAKKKAEHDMMTLMEKNIKPRAKRKIKDTKSKLHRKRKFGAGILKTYGDLRRKI